MWGLTIGQHKWILHALTSAKRLIYWKDKNMPPFDQLIDDMRTLETHEESSDKDYAWRN